MKFSYIIFIIALFIGNCALAKPSSALIKPEYYDFPEALQFHDSMQTKYREVRQIIKSVNIANKQKNFSGTVLIGYKGKIVYEKSYGFANRSLGIPNTPFTSTQIASISKTFTGMGVMWLVDRNKIHIQDPVQKYLPEFPYENITVENLLSHRSGLQEYMKFSSRYWTSKSTPMRNQDVLDMLATKNLSLAFLPNTNFDYCNTNYALLALIIEKASGVEYSSFMNDYIFKPLHMNHTFVFDPAKEVSLPIAQSYNANFSIWKNNYQDGVVGDKGIFTTAEDLYKWDQALYSDKFISKENRNDAFVPRSPIGSSIKNYGLGWRMYVYPNYDRVLYHTGWWHGYQGVFSRYVDDNFTVIILSNKFTKGIRDNSTEIYNSVSDALHLKNYGSYNSLVDED